jgi:hypothetical protein
MTSRHDLRWSRSEKAIVGKAFDAALERQIHGVTQEAKRMATPIKQSLDLWNLEYYLTERRKQINCRYEHRSSQLTLVFGRLLYECRVIKNSCAACGKTN